MLNEKQFPPLFQSVATEHQAQVIRELNYSIHSLQGGIDEARDDLKELEAMLNRFLYGEKPPVPRLQDSERIIINRAIFTAGVCHLKTSNVTFSFGGGL